MVVGRVERIRSNWPSMKIDVKDRLKEQRVTFSLNYPMYVFYCSIWLIESSRHGERVISQTCISSNIW